MARKRVWLSWLPAAADAGSIQGLTGALGKAGLEVDGALFNRDLAKVGWSETAAALVDDARVDLWLIVGTLADFADTGVRYGLSLAQASVLAKREQPLPMVIAGLDGAPQAQSFPPLLQRARCLAPPQTGWAPQVVAAAMRREPPPTEDFRFSIIAHPALGQWFEVGPMGADQWRGAIFGIDAGEITHQGVGASGSLPQQCTLEYPSQGIRVDLGGHSYDCWAVRNTLERGQSLFVRVVGSPGRLLFGELPEQDEADLRVLELV